MEIRLEVVGEDISPLEAFTDEEFAEAEIDLLESGGGSGPRVVDFEMTGTCRWRCEWCWGPDHAEAGGLNETEWGRITSIFTTLGTERITITGGEPLLSKHLTPTILSAAEHGVDVTLSTTGDGLHKRSDVLEALLECSSPTVGIPLDGPNPGINSMMRPSLNKANEGDNFQKSIDAIKFLQDVYPGIGITLRTVVASQNARSVAEIPDALIANGVDVSTIRWKLYQLNPNDGPRTESASAYEIDDDEFDEVSVEAQARWQRSFSEVDVQRAEGSDERYMFVEPSGKVRLLGGAIADLGIDPSDLDMKDNPFGAAKEIIDVINGWYMPRLLSSRTGHWVVDYYYEEPEEHGAPILEPR